MNATLVEQLKKAKGMNHFRNHFRKSQQQDEEDDTSYLRHRKDYSDQQQLVEGLRGVRRGENDTSGFWSDEKILQMYQPNDTESSHDGLNTLHVAIFRKSKGRVIQASAKIIDRILKLQPELVRELDNRNLTPLHRKLSIEDYYFDQEIFFLLLYACPEAATIPDTLGNYPLHTASHFSLKGYVDDDDEEMSKTSIKIKRRSIDDDKEEEDEIRKRKKNGLILSCLIDTYPEAVLKKNHSLLTPLHIAIVSNPPSIDILTALLTTHPKNGTNACRSQNKLGQTPLVMGIKSMAPWRCLLEILKAYPEAAAICDWDSGDWGSSTKRSDTDDNDDGTTLFWDGNVPLHLAIRYHYPTEFLEELLLASPNVAKVRDRDGQLPLHLALFHNTDPKFVLQVLKEFRDATWLEDARCRPILHSALENTDVHPTCISLLILYNPNGTREVKKSSRYVLPLHVAIAHGVSSDIIQILLSSYEKAVSIEDYYDTDNLPLHLGLIALEQYWDQLVQQENILCSLDLLLKAYPEATKIHDHEGQTPLFRLCNILNSNTEQWSECIDLLQDIYNCYPAAAELSCSVGASPVNVLVEECCTARTIEGATKKKSIDKLRILVKNLRDGRALQPLCGTRGLARHRLMVSTRNGFTSSKSNISMTFPSLRIFLLLFEVKQQQQQGQDDKDDEEEEVDNDAKTTTTTTLSSSIPSLDLNQTVIPGWTLLEMLADFDSPEASTILLQIVEDQKRLLWKEKVEISITLKTADFSTKEKFISLVPVMESTLTKVADRARLAKSSSNLRRWGQEHGRFLRRYRLDKAPKHISETCLVIFATEAMEDTDGRHYEAPVALKFMHSQSAFQREIEKRSSTQAEYVMPIRAFFSSSKDVTHDFSSGHVEDSHFGVELLHDELLQHLTFKLQGNQKFEFLLVMERGAGIDLHDVINHRNIAGRDLFTVTSVALDIAKILQFLNETCQVIHGDVKARNFVALGDGVVGFRAVDLDNAASIANDEHAGQKRTSSGYLPPEMAAVEAYHRSNESGGVMASINSSNSIEKMKETLRTAMDASDFVLVAKISQELNLAISCQTTKPRDVIASPQYDMWCFGTLLYYLCTGIQIFNLDVREEIVETDDLAKLADWNDDLKASKLDKVGPGWPKRLLSRLLEKDPCKRPNSWDLVIEELTKVSRVETSKKARAGHVFVSYSRKDSTIMRQIYRYFVDNHIPTWIDAELVPGTPGWTQGIEQALLDADLVLVICSPSTKKSEWVNKELLHALDQKVPILPILIHGDAGQSIPFAIYDFQHIDARSSVSQNLPAMLQNAKDLIAGR